MYGSIIYKYKYVKINTNTIRVIHWYIHLYIFLHYHQKKKITIFIGSKEKILLFQYHTRDCRRKQSNHKTGQLEPSGQSVRWLSLLSLFIVPKFTGAKGLIYAAGKPTQHVCVCMRERKRERICVWVCMCVCVCERERKQK